MIRDVTPTTPATALPTERQRWSAPTLRELPKLTALTLASAIGGGGGTGGGGSTVFGLLLAAGLVLGVTACSPELGSPSDQTLPPVASAQFLTCHADIAAHSLDCAAPQRAPGQGILGDQGVNVGLRSTNVAYNGGSGILSADVTVQNLSGGPIGTLDGTTKSSGVSVFFVSGPTASPTGTVTVDNATGTGTFTAGGQPYFLYDQLLQPAQVSSLINWHFLFAGGATSFTFTVLVAADQPAPGTIQSWQMLPGYGAITWEVMSGWGADGLALMGSHGERAVHENGIWKGSHDPVENIQFNRGAAWAASANNVAGFGYSYDLSAYVARQWDGTGWRYIHSLSGGPGGNALTILQAAGNSYALGYGLWRFTGTGWTSTAVPGSTSGLVAGFEANGGMVVIGTSTEAWLYKGGVYTKLGTGSSGQGFGGVAYAFGSDTTHVWTTAAYSGDAEVRFYNGAGWSTQTLPFNDDADAVYPSGGTAVADTSAFIIANGGGTAYVFHWNGSNWSTEHVVGGTYNAIWARNGNEIYFARTDGTVERRDNAGNYTDYLTSGASMVAAVALYSDTGGYAFRNSGTVLHWNGSSLDSVGVGVANPGVAWAADGQHAWIAHYSNSIGYWNGASMVSQPLGGTTVAAGVGGSGTSDIWAVGFGGDISHYNGTSWTMDVAGSALTSNLLWSVYAKNASFAVAVGSGGTILMWDGLSWSMVTSPTGLELRGVHGTSVSNVWAVGNGGTIAHWDGANWTSQTVGSTNLYGVWARNSNEAYAVGDDGKILRYNGTSWVAQGIGAYAPNTSLRGISGHGGTTLVVGDRVLVGSR